MQKEARINSEIENDLLATPSDTPHAYGDSKDEDVARQEAGLQIVSTWRDVNGRLVRQDTCPVLLVPVVPEWVWNPRNLP